MFIERIPRPWAGDRSTSSIYWRTDFMQRSLLPVLSFSIFVLILPSTSGAQTKASPAVSSESSGPNAAAVSEQQEMRDELRALRSEVERLRAEVERQKDTAPISDRSQEPAAARTVADPHAASVSATNFANSTTATSAASATT